MKLLFVAAFTLLACRAMGDFKAEVLGSHNQYRKKHGVEQLTWDTKVANFADNWCKSLAAKNKMEHSSGSGYGENLYQSSSWSSRPATTSTDGAGTNAVKSWYDEIQAYNFNRPGFSSATGHFTQVSQNVRMGNFYF